jgi:urease accessory protein
MKTYRSFVAQPLAALTMFAAALPAAAHHPMGGTTPSTWFEGLLSGFGHPIIGLDHLLFILAVGVACYYFGPRITTIAVFLIGALAGTLVHLRMPGVPYAEAWVAASLIVLGLLFFRRSAFLKSQGAMVLFGLAGLAHGYAYGEAIVGAETAPLLAYLSGFTLMQFAIALGGYATAHYAVTKKPAFAFLNAAGSSLAVAGAGFLVFALAA